jgi:hypothetical protein
MMGKAPPRNVPSRGRCNLERTCGGRRGDTGCEQIRGLLLARFGSTRPSDFRPPRTKSAGLCKNQIGNDRFLRIPAEDPHRFGSDSGHLVADPIGHQVRFSRHPEPQLSAVRAGLANDRSRRGKRSDATKSEAARRPPLDLGGEPQEKCGLKRAMNDKTRVALHFGHTRLIIVDAVAIESQGRVAKQ